jgi:hypothetical protein
VLGDNEQPTAFCNIEMMEMVHTGTAVTIENKLGGSVTPCYWFMV